MSNSYQGSWMGIAQHWNIGFVIEKLQVRSLAGVVREYSFPISFLC